MNKLLAVLLSTALLSGVGTEALATANGPSDYELALHWAPVWMQDTDSSNEKADYITRFDYDGDWKGANNWEHLGTFPLPAYVYFAVFETTTHYFIEYADFHPRDWSEWCTSLHCHENDLEGLMVVVKKDGSEMGQFHLMITIAHLDFYSYKDKQSALSNAVTTGHEDVDGDVQFDSGHHPYVYVEAKGHGVFGAKRWETDNFPGGDGVVYYPTSAPAEQPSSGNDRIVNYRLLSMNQLWSRRYDFTTTYSNFGVFKGNTYGDNKALAPWRWDDHDDGAAYAGDFYFDPARLVQYYHDGLESFSQSYVYSSDGLLR